MMIKQKCDKTTQNARKNVINIEKWQYCTIYSVGRAVDS